MWNMERVYVNFKSKERVAEQAELLSVVDLNSFVWSEV
jgi:hypothetical protein